MAAMRESSSTPSSRRSFAARSGSDAATFICSGSDCAASRVLALGPQVASGAEPGGDRERPSARHRGGSRGAGQGRQCVRCGGGRQRRARRGRAVGLGHRRRRHVPAAPGERRQEHRHRCARGRARRGHARHVSRRDGNPVPGRSTNTALAAGIPGEPAGLALLQSSSASCRSPRVSRPPSGSRATASSCIRGCRRGCGSRRSQIAKTPDGAQRVPAQRRGARGRHAAQAARARAHAADARARRRRTASTRASSRSSWSSGVRAARRHLDRSGSR